MSRALEDLKGARNRGGYLGPSRPWGSTAARGRDGPWRGGIRRGASSGRTRRPSAPGRRRPSSGWATGRRRRRGWPRCGPWRSVSLVFGFAIQALRRGQRLARARRSLMSRPSRASLVPTPGLRRRPDRPSRPRPGRVATAAGRADAGRGLPDRSDDVHHHRRAGDRRDRPRHHRRRAGRGGASWATATGARRERAKTAPASQGEAARWQAHEVAPVECPWSGLLDSAM
jgi:hypothetical protein